MRISYDPETDSLTIRFRDVPIDESDEITPDVIADLAADGEVVDLEVLSASRVIDNAEEVLCEKTG